MSLSHSSCSSGSWGQQQSLRLGLFSLPADSLDQDRKHRKSCDAEKGRDCKDLLDGLSHVLGAVGQLETMRTKKGHELWQPGPSGVHESTFSRLRKGELGGSSDGPGQKSRWAAGSGVAVLVLGRRDAAARLSPQSLTFSLGISMKGFLTPWLTCASAPQQFRVSCRVDLAVPLIPHGCPQLAGTQAQPGIENAVNLAAWNQGFRCTHLSQRLQPLNAPPADKAFQISAKTPEFRKPYPQPTELMKEPQSRLAGKKPPKKPSRKPPSPVPAAMYQSKKMGKAITTSAQGALSKCDALCVCKADSVAPSQMSNDMKPGAASPSFSSMSISYALAGRLPRAGL
ncbi:hypothetical protein P7K49_008921 [Saguinus oedipus]|uniref:Uncharacterized protein n=1 Tax=Saguinus oedipus TaxID=9490 RepID=A0ABQ9VZN6_SAGOE|nr:hypothetical protein P7K49_008921 [Saguinus oedipus]